MNPTIESLKETHSRILTEADQQDDLGMAEVLAGNAAKEYGHRSAAAGLRIAAGIVADEIQTQEVWEEVDAMTPEQITSFLGGHGFDPKSLRGDMEVVKAKVEKRLRERT